MNKEELISEYKERATDVVLLQDIDKKEITASQQKTLTEAKTFIRENFEDIWSALTDRDYMVLRDFEEPFGRWQSVELSTKPPLVTNQTLNAMELSDLSAKVQSGYNSVSGVLEDVMALHRSFEDIIDRLEKQFKLLCVDSKVTTAGQLFMTLLPADISQKRESIAMYVEIFKRRLEAFENCKQTIRQLIDINLRVSTDGPEPVEAGFVAKRSARAGR